MIKRTDEHMLHDELEIRDGVWIHMVDPTEEECQEVAEKFDLDETDIRAALDADESARIELQDGYTLILVDIPTVEVSHSRNTYTTIPLGIILKKDLIITICSEDTMILQRFLNNRVKEFSTKKKLRFVYQILLLTSNFYQTDLKILEKRRKEIEDKIRENPDDVDLFDLHELENTLVYFATSLQANSMVIDRLTRYKRLEQFPEDKEILDDVIIENKQALEMTATYRNIIDGTRELLASVMDNRLNNVMRYLTAITLVMAIPTIISGIYGMNVNEAGMPFAASQYGFGIICVATLVICVIALLILKKKKML